MGADDSVSRRELRQAKTDLVDSELTVITRAFRNNPSDCSVFDDTMAQLTETAAMAVRDTLPVQPFLQVMASIGRIHDFVTGEGVHGCKRFRK